MDHEFQAFPAIALILLLTLLTLLYLQAAAAWRTRSWGRPLPPGPKPLPGVGNMFDIPKVKQWVAYQAMSAKFGPIVYLRALGQRLVVLGNGPTVLDFLGRGSANTADRAQTPMFELAGMDISFSSMPYGERWRQHRRAFWQYFHPAAITAYQPVQRSSACKFLVKLLESPLEFKSHIRYTFAIALAEILYGITDPGRQQEIIAMVETVMQDLGELFLPGKYLVEFFPSLRHIPPWVPGATVQRESVKWRAAVTHLKDKPLRYMGEAMGDGLPCIVRRMLEKIEGTPNAQELEIVKNIAVVTFEAGADTVFSTVQSAFLAMSLYPEVQKSAQAELDSVVGSGRLPDFDDRDALVYIQAIIKESLRWQNVVPFALPHRTIQDDELNGYFIPAGTVIMPNVWACMHNPDVYEDPDKFRPERFIRDGKLDPTVQDPTAFVFGFGRRICPGRYFADNALFINLASVLHVFDISPPLDENGLEIEIKPEMTDGLIS